MVLLPPPPASSRLPEHSPHLEPISPPPIHSPHVILIISLPTFCFSRTAAGLSVGGFPPMRRWSSLSLGRCAAGVKRAPRENAHAPRENAPDIWMPGEMLITPGREDGRVRGSKAGPGAVRPQSARVESVPLRSAPTTEGRRLGGDTLYAPLAACVAQPTASRECGKDLTPLFLSVPEAVRERDIASPLIWSSSSHPAGGRCPQQRSA
ncbi:hypothetical protein EYF80_013371 [Liparis tanakae]|uniref:Uncharacterized protein n=1 Tax=Liparis tanakae TaxID=230148 RepID=A0A4Z2IEX8_9TELE|nr:hypothetical protein EYF80_013371 [Liparis tanakae]